MDVTSTTFTIKKNNTFKSVSALFAPEKQKSSSLKCKEVQTKIFKGVCFYLDDKIRKEKCLEKIVHVIKEHSGLPYSDIKKYTKMYCVLNDSLEA